MRSAKAFRGLLNLVTFGTLGAMIMYLVTKSTMPPSQSYPEGMEKRSQIRKYPDHKLEQKKPVAKDNANTKQIYVDSFDTRATQGTDSCKGPLNAILIGIGKCGTTTLLDFASIHPDISNLGIPWIFLDGSNRTLSDNVNRKKCIPANKVQLSKLENRSNVKKVRDTNPEMKILVSVCEPVRRFISAFTHYEYETFQKVRQDDLEELKWKLENLISCMNSKENFQCKKPEFFFDYPGLMEQWLPFFNLDQFHFIDGDDFKSNPVPELQKLETFLGVRPYLNQSHFVFDKKKGFYCKRLPDEVSCMGDNKGRTHPNLPERYEKGLQQYARSYNKRFYNLVNKTFPWGDHV